jgi:DNA-binding SARP family transcriptional activator
VRASVLVYLAMEREATRDTLVGMFWPDFTEARARNALSQTLHRLRSDLGDWMRAEVEAVVVAEGVAIDARAFELAVERGDQAAALELYTGEFLVGWRLVEAHETQVWIDRQRARLAGLYEAAVVARIRELEEAGELALAVATARRWVELSPLAEDAQATLIQLLARSGARSEAGRQYRAFARGMAAEDLEISPAVADGLDRILAEAAASPPAAAASSRPGVLVEPFRNRTGRDELAALGPMIADWITEGLDRTGMVSVETLRVPAPDSGKEPTVVDEAPDFAAGSRTRFVVGGSYYRVSRELEVCGQVLDRKSGELAGAIEPVRVGPGDEEAAVARTRDRVMGLLATLLDQDWTGFPTPPELGSRPPTFEAYRAYCRGLDHFLREEYTRAIPELEAACRLDEGLTRQDVFYEHAGVREEELFAAAFKGVWSATYTLTGPRIALDYTGTVVGPMRLPAYDAPFERATRSETYSVHNLMATWRGTRGFEVYAGIRNLLDYTQPSPIVDPANPFGDSFDTAWVYGPLVGRSLVVGARYGLGR